MKLFKWFGNSSFNFSCNPVTRLGFSLTVHLILQFRFFIFKTDVDTYSSSFFRHQIHCGQLFLLQNVKIKQFINFSLRVGDRLLKYLFGHKICVMSMFFLLIYNKRQTLMLVDSEYFHVLLVPMFLIN